MTTTLNKPKDHVGLVQEYFDNNAQSWHDYYQGGKSLTHIILKDRMQIGLAYLNRFLPPDSNPKVLDAGCGSGLIGVAMARQGYQVDGWDISEKMIALSKMNFETAGISAELYNLTHGNLLASNLERNQYDAIMALGFLQYQPNESEVLAIFHDLLKPGGILVMSGPVGIKLSNYFGMADKLRQMKRRRRKTAEPQTQRAKERQHLHIISANNYSVQRFRSLLESADFQMLDYRGHGYAHFDFLSRRLPNRHQKRLHRWLTKAARVIPIQRYANDMVVVAKTAQSPVDTTT